MAELERSKRAGIGLNAELAGNLKLAILVESVALVVGNWIDGPYRETMLWVTVVSSLSSVSAGTWRTSDF